MCRHRFPSDYANDVIPICPNQVLPLVYFGILDHYARRNTVQQRVIGTLLGNKGANGVIEVTNYFPVPHNETDEHVAVDMEYHRSMFDLHRQINSKEVIVGWYASGSEITDYSVLIHDFYARETENPVHLCLDTEMSDARMAVNAYVTAPMGVPGETVGSLFTPVKTDTLLFEPERVGLKALSHTMTSKDNSVPLLTDLEHVSSFCSGHKISGYCLSVN